MIIVWQDKKKPVHLYGTPGVYDTFATFITIASGPLLLFFNFKYSGSYVSYSVDMAIIKQKKKGVNMSWIVQKETTASPQGTYIKIVSEMKKYEKTFGSAFPSF